MSSSEWAGIGVVIELDKEKSWQELDQLYETDRFATKGLKLLPDCSHYERQVTSTC